MVSGTSMSSPLTASQPWPSLFPLVHQTDKITISLFQPGHFLHTISPPKMPCLLPMPLRPAQTPTYPSKPISNATFSKTLSWSSSTLPSLEHFIDSSLLASIITFCHTSESITCVSGHPSWVISYLKARFISNWSWGTYGTPTHVLHIIGAQLTSGRFFQFWVVVSSKQ